MKKTIFVALLFLLSAICAFCQEHSIKAISSDYGSSTKTPMMLENGDTLAIACDSLYLVNKVRYNFYKNIHMATLKNKDSVYSRLLLQYEHSLTERQEAYDKLLRNCNQSEKLATELIDYSQNTLVSTKNTLENTQITLTQTQEELKQAVKEIKAAETKSILEKVLIGVGGTAVGLIVGILIAK